MAKTGKSNMVLIESAFTLFSSGNHQAGLNICKKILRKFPNDLNALNLTGIIKDKLNEKEEAIKYFKKASKVAPKNTDILTNIGITSFEINALEEAKKYLNLALETNPLATEALFNLANIALTENNIEQAISLYERTIKLKPDHIKSFNNLGNIYHNRKELEKSEQCYKSAIEIASHFTEALAGLCYVLFDREKYGDAIKYSNELLQIQPDNGEILLLIGRIYIHENELHKAKDYLLKSISADNNNPESHKLYGIILEKLSGELSNDSKGSKDELIHQLNKESLIHLIRSYELAPDQYKVASNIGKHYLTDGDFVQAKHYFKKSLEINPENSAVLNSLGIIYQELRDYPLAKSMYEKSILADENYCSAHINLGNLYLELQDTNTAKSHIEKALSIDPENESAKKTLCLIYLLIQDYDKGWHYYRFRPSVIMNEADFAPEALPDTLEGKKLLIIKDQGIGDELFFLRFIKQLKSYGPHISYLPNPKLLPIIKSLELVDALLTEMQDKNKFDLCLSIGDLPYLLKHKNAANTPAPLSLKTTPEQTAIVEKVLSEFGPPPYIAITWRAGHRISNKRLDSYLKEVDLLTISNLIKNIPGTVIAIQKNATHDEFDYISRQISRPILDASVYHDDLPKMLSLLQLADKYITVSNTNVHMREGLEKTSHVLVCSPPEWRWLERGKSTHWFPSSLIYRQQTDQSWEPAITELLADLS